MTLYLLHGALGSAEQFAPLLASGVDAATIELAGHGNTPLAGREFSIATFVAQVRQRLDDDAVECAELFGYSMGGYVALALALTHPERVSRIMTLGTKFEWTPEVAAREVARLHPDKMRAKVPLFAAALEERHAGAGGWESTLGLTRSLLQHLGERPLLNEAELGRIAVPVCVGVGDRDASVSVAESERVSRQLGDGSLAVIPSTPHAFEQVRPDVLTALLRDVFPKPGEVQRP